MKVTRSSRKRSNDDHTVRDVETQKCIRQADSAVNGSDISPDIFRINRIQKFNSKSSPDEMSEYYKKYKILHIQNVFPPGELYDKFGMHTIQSLFRKMSGVVDNTFTIENSDEMKRTSSSLFGHNACARGDWYASFILQKTGDCDPNSFIGTLPLQSLPVFNSSERSVMHTSPIWFFVGKNEDKNRLLEGRPEHTDSVQHDGTWHLQCQCSKIWYVRPADSAEWGERNLTIPSVGDADSVVTGCDVNDGLSRLVVEVCQGDVLVINTRLWWHQTRIPYTGRRGYSISYARDFYTISPHLPTDKETGRMRSGRRVRTSVSTGTNARENGPSVLPELIDNEDVAEAYTNVDALYAAARFQAGDVVLTESDLPDCSLPRCADNPSCEVAWMPDGTGALVALRDLNVGDWLTVAPSDDDEDDEEGDDDDDDDEVQGDFDDDNVDDDNK